VPGSAGPTGSAQSAEPEAVVGFEPIVLTPIGVIHTGHHDPGRTPIQPVCAAGSDGSVRVFDEFVEGLDDLDGFSHIYLLYAFHKAWAAPLKVVPYLSDEPRGVFATRSPDRPNHLGLSLVRLVERRGATLLVEDVDVLDGTPLLDIKPFVARFDTRPDSRGGWTDAVDEETFRGRGSRRPGSP
jgi:tRNA-Thr(GGU) m(6)t(6)A37 methyltransferase TsaA